MLALMLTYELVNPFIHKGLVYFMEFSFVCDKSLLVQKYDSIMR